MEKQKKKRKYSKVSNKQNLVPLEYRQDTSYAMSKKALYLSKRALSLSAQEWKYHDFGVGFYCSPSYNTTCLNQVPVGTYAYQRVGDSLKMKRLTVRLNLSIHASATDSIARIILLYSPRMKFMPISAYTDIFQYDSIYSPKRIDRKKEFMMLYDRTFIMTMVYQPRQFHIIKSFDLFDKKEEFASGTTNLETGGLYLIVKGSEVTNQPYIEGYTRMYFTE